jgi:hypothetical protein
MYHQRRVTRFGVSETPRRLVRLALGDPLFLLLVVLLVLDFALGTDNGFPIRLVDPRTAQKCPAVYSADGASNGRHVQSTFKGRLSGLIF